MDEVLGDAYEVMGVVGNSFELSSEMTIRQGG